MKYSSKITINSQVPLWNWHFWTHIFFHFMLNEEVRALGRQLWCKWAPASDMREKYQDLAGTDRNWLVFQRTVVHSIKLHGKASPSYTMECSLFSDHLLLLLPSPFTPVSNVTIIRGPFRGLLVLQQEYGFWNKAVLSSNSGVDNF